MTKKFRLNLTISDLATGEDVAKALRAVADTVQHFDSGGLKPGLSFGVANPNGAYPQGSWSVSDADPRPIKGI